MENLQPYDGKHFLMDLMNHSSCTTSFTHMTSFTPVPYSCQNVLATSLSATTVNLMASSSEALSSNSKLSSTDVSQMSNNDCTINPNHNEPTTTNTLNQLIRKGILFRNNDPNIKQFTDLPTTNTLVEIKQLKTKNKINKTTLNSTKCLQMNASESNSDKSILNETAVEDYSSYVSNGEEFSCLICDVNFWTEELLNTHLEGNKFSCRICTAEFINHSELKTHFLSHRTYRCIICKKVFLSKEDLFNHKKSSLTCTFKFECDICKKMMSSEVSVRKHKQSVHRPNSILYNCEVCSKKFLLPFQLNAHQTKSHVAYENVECKKCSASFLGPEKLKLHIKMSHLKKREICPFTCSVCGKVLYFKRALEKHERSHSERKVVCELCGKSFKGASGLYNHNKYSHLNENKYKCLTCNKEYKCKSSLTVHVNNVHNQKAKTPAVCEICGKTLKNKEQLKSHVLIHSSERRFKCDVCSATFKQLVALRTHSRIHTNVCKYNCNDCGKSFRWKQTFDKHVKKCETSQS